MAQSSTGGSRRWGSVLDPHSSTFRSFADTLLVGVLIALAAIPVLTAYAGMGSGIQVLRDARESDGYVTIGGFGKALLVRLRRWPGQVAVPVLVLAVVAVDAVLLPALVADRLVSQALTIVLVTAIVGFGIRYAMQWRPEQPGAAGLRAAYRAFVSDGSGTLLIAAGIVTAGALVTIAPVLAIVVAGPVALAAVAIQLRYEGRNR